MPYNPIIGKDQLQRIENGFCYGISFLHSFNNRQKDIGNNFIDNNPTEIMYDVFNDLVNKRNKSFCKDKNFAQKLQKILNYIFPLQSTEQCMQDLKYTAEKEKQNNPRIEKIEYNTNLFDHKSNSIFLQSTNLVDPFNEKIEPLKIKKIKPLKIKKIFNRVNVINDDIFEFGLDLDNLKYLIHPGVLIDLSSLVISFTPSGDRSGHAMSCYMKYNEEIIFYDPNFGEELTFKDVTNLIDYLKDEHKVKFKGIFPKNKCIIRIFNLNNNDSLQEEIENHYNNIEEILNQNHKLRYQELSLQKFSKKLRKLCQKDLKKCSKKFKIKSNGINIPDHQKIKMPQSQQKILIKHICKKLNKELEVVQIESEQVSVSDVKKVQNIAQSNILENFEANIVNKSKFWDKIEDDFPQFINPEENDQIQENVVFAGDISE